MGLAVQWASFWVGVALAVITLLAVIVALFKDFLWDSYNKPIIKVGFGNTKPYVIDFYFNSKMTLLFRLKIVNLGKTIAKNCRVKIISVVPENGDKKESLVDEEDILKWSSAPRDMRYRIDSPNIARVQDISQLIPIYRETKDITPGGGWEFCDLFRIDTQEKKIAFASSGERDFLAEDKNYIVTIEISGDNLKPTKKEIKFSVPYKVNQTTFAMELAEIKEVRNISQ